MFKEYNQLYSKIININNKMKVVISKSIKGFLLSNEMYEYMISIGYEKQKNDITYINKKAYSYHPSINDRENYYLIKTVECFSSNPFLYITELPDNTKYTIERDYEKGGECITLL